MDDVLNKWFYDALLASKNILTFISDKSFEDYSDDILLASAVERQFEVLGEALKRIRDHDESFLDQVKGWRGAISFRNILAHGYDHIESTLVWSIIQDDLHPLVDSLDILLNTD